MGSRTRLRPGILLLMRPESGYIAEEGFDWDGIMLVIRTEVWWDGAWDYDVLFGVLGIDEDLD